MKRKFARMRSNHNPELTSCSGAPTKIPGALKLRNRIGIKNWWWRRKPHRRALLKMLKERQAG